MKVKVKVVPTSGDSREVEVEATMTSLRDVLREAGISADATHFQYAVDGRPQDNLDAAISDGSSLVITEKARGS
ncbi:MAG: hypothetical protein V4682_01955 [Patescibacteria group bacterium]